MGWQDLANGELIAKAEAAGFDILISTDQNIRYQQAISGRSIALLILLKQNWPELEPHTGKVAKAIGDYTAANIASYSFRVGLDDSTLQNFLSLRAPYATTLPVPRKLSSIAPDWWDYTTLEPEIIRDAAALTPERMLKLSRPGFKVVMYETLEEFYLAEALDYITAWKQSTPDNPVGICGPIGPTEQ